MAFDCGLFSCNSRYEIYIYTKYNSVFEMDHGGNSANVLLTSLVQPEPVRASQLSTDELNEQERLSTMKPLRYGCAELDNAVLLGGLRRGSIVGVSADDVDGFGLLVGLHSILRDADTDPIRWGCK